MSSLLPLAWWLLVLHWPRGAGDRTWGGVEVGAGAGKQPPTQSLLGRDGGICACCASCKESFPSLLQGGREGAWVSRASGVREADLLLCSTLLCGKTRAANQTLNRLLPGAGRHVWEDERDEQAAASMRGLEVFAPRSSQRLPVAPGIPCVLLPLIRASLAPGLSPLPGF